MTYPTANSMNSAFKKGVALVMLVLLVGCQTMQPVAEPRVFLQSRQPSVVWLAKSSDPTMFVLEGPQLLGDSIVGFVEGEYTEIPIATIKSMQAKQYSRGRTTAFLVGAGAAVLALTFIITGGMGSSYDMTDEDDIGILQFRR